MARKKKKEEKVVDEGHAIALQAKWTGLDPKFGSKQMRRLGWVPLELSVRGRHFKEERDAKFLPPISPGSRQIKYVKHKVDINYLLGCDEYGKVHTRGPYSPVTLAYPERYDEYRDEYLSHVTEDEIVVRHLLVEYVKRNGFKGMKVLIVPSGSGKTKTIGAATYSINGKEVYKYPKDELEVIGKLFGKVTIEPCKIIEQKTTEKRSCLGGGLKFVVG